MIVRIFQVTVFDDRIDEFRAFFTKTAIPLVKRQPGLVSLIAGLPVPENPAEFSMVMIWDSVDAIRAFAGDDWQQPHVDPSEKDLVRDRRLSHYRMATA